MKTYESEFKAGEAAVRVSAMEDARAHFAAACTLAQDDVAAAEALSRLGRVCGTLGDFQEAERALREAMQRAVSAPETLARVRVNLGTVRWMRGDAKAARMFLEQAATDFARLDLPPERVRALSNLAIVLMAMGAYEPAIAALQEAIEIHTRLDDMRGVSIDLNNLGECYSQLGALDHARPLFERALALAEEHGYPQFTVDALRNLGLLYAQAGDLERGVEAVELGLARAGQYQRQYLRTQALAALAEVRLLRGELAEARAAAEDLLAVPGASPADRAAARLALGRCELAQGDGTRALVTLQEGLPQAQASGSVMLILRYHVALSQVRDHPAVARMHARLGREMAEQVAAGLADPELRKAFRAAALFRSIG